MVCLLVLLLGSETAGAQIRTVLVSPVPGNEVASGTALRNALAGISSPSSTNRWLLKIEPGIYDIGTTQLQMRSWVDIEGSGIGVTTIRGSVSYYGGTIHGANNAELRLLTVEALSSGMPGPIAMVNDLASPRLYRVKFLTQDNGVGVSWGIRNINAEPLIEECEINVAGTTAPTDSTFAYGVVFRNDTCSLPTGRSSILRTKITVSGADNRYGLYLANGQFVSEIRDSRIEIVGGQATYGIYAYSESCGWLGNQVMQIRNSEIYSSAGSSASYGIKIHNEPVTLTLDISGSRVFGHHYGIVQAGPNPIGVQWSHIYGATNTIDSRSNVAIQSTYLQGGPATASGWLGCMGVWDENAVFYANGCP